MSFLSYRRTFSRRERKVNVPEYILKKAFYTWEVSSNASFISKLIHQMSLLRLEYIEEVSRKPRSNWSRFDISQIKAYIKFTRQPNKLITQEVEFLIAEIAQKGHPPIQEKYYKQLTAFLPLQLRKNRAWHKEIT